MLCSIIRSVSDHAVRSTVAACAPERSTSSGTFLDEGRRGLPVQSIGRAAQVADDPGVDAGRPVWRDPAIDEVKGPVTTPEADDEPIEATEQGHHRPRWNVTHRSPSRQAMAVTLHPAARQLWTWM